MVSWPGQLRLGAGHGGAAGRPTGGATDRGDRSAGLHGRAIAQDHGAVPGAAELDHRVRSLRRRLLLAASLFMPLCDMSIFFSLYPGCGSRNGSG